MQKTPITLAATVDTSCVSQLSSDSLVTRSKNDLDLKHVNSMVYHSNFFLRKERTNSLGEYPIYLRISYNGKPAEISLDRFVLPTSWENGKVKGNSKEAQALNEYIKTLSTKLDNVFNGLLRRDAPITSAILKAKLLGKEVTILPNQKTVLAICEDHIQIIKESVKKGEHETATLESYETVKKHIANFIQVDFETSDVTVNMLTYGFIQNFFLYLKSDTEYKGKPISKKSCKTNSALKYIKNFKTIVKDQAIAHGLILVDPFILFKQKGERHKVKRLKEWEVNKIMDKKIENERLAAIRDFFIFQCFTGLAYVDLERLKYHHIEININGNKQIKMARKKSDTDFCVPLLPPAEQILNKYKNHPICINKGTVLPIISNQNYNNYLKELAVICDFSRIPLTTHVGRRSFASIALNNKIPIETIIAAIGHIDFATIGDYAEYDEETIDNNFSPIKHKYESRIANTI